MQNREIMGQYLYSQLTAEKVTPYLEALCSGQKKPGLRLQSLITQTKVNLEKLGPTQFVALLMNTRQPKLFAESEATIGVGKDWTAEENAILADVIFSTTGTHAYNTGEHDGFTNYPEDERPEVHFLFVSSPLLRNDQGCQTSDMLELIRADGSINAEAYYRMIERRLLPGLLVQNRDAVQTNTPLVLNIPGLGLGQFAGKHRDALRRLLPQTLRRLFDQHGKELIMFKVVNYDPYSPLLEKDTFSGEIHGIHLMARPYQRCAPGAPAAQLAYPKDGRDYTGYRIVKVVAWDPFSFPGNDIWIKFSGRPPATEHYFGRKTDDGVAFASSDALVAMVAMGQFGQGNEISVEYSSHRGIVYPMCLVEQSIQSTVWHLYFVEQYLSNVTAEMLDVVSIPVTLLSSNLQSPRQTEERTAFVQALQAKLHIMKQYTNGGHTELELRKTALLRQIVQQVEQAIQVFLAIPEPSQSDLDTLYNQVNAVASQISPEDQAVLAQHRQPILRWLKEIAAMILTLGAPLIYTGYRAYRMYQQDPAHFSWKNVPFGLFSETRSLAALRGLQTCIENAGPRRTQ